MAGVTGGTGVTGGDILSHVTRVLKAARLGVKGSGNGWHRVYRAPGRLPVRAMLVEDRYSLRNIVMRSGDAVMEVAPGDDGEIVDAYRIVSTPPPRQKEPEKHRGEGHTPPSEAEGA